MRGPRVRRRTAEVSDACLRLTRLAQEIISRQDDLGRRTRMVAVRKLKETAIAEEFPELAPEPPEPPAARRILAELNGDDDADDRHLLVQLALEQPFAPYVIEVDND